MFPAPTIIVRCESVGNEPGLTHPAWDNTEAVR
jgi:hypothetical protein